MASTVADRWFTGEDRGDRVTAITEPHVNAFFRSWMFHLPGRDADLVVDAGMGLACLSSVLPLTPGKPVIAVASHVHADHVGSLHEFADRRGHRDEADAFSSMADADTFADIFREMHAPVTALPREGWQPEDYRIAPARLTTILEAGDTVDLGDRVFRVLHLPGHSHGCIALLDERDGLMFSGDSIYDSDLVDDLPCSDREAYRNTMRRLLDVDVRIVHGGHGPAFDKVRLNRIALDYLDAAD